MVLFETTPLNADNNALVTGILVKNAKKTESISITRPTLIPLFNMYTVKISTRQLNTIIVIAFTSPKP